MNHYGPNLRPAASVRGRECYGGAGVGLNSIQAKPKGSAKCVNATGSKIGFELVTGIQFYVFANLARYPIGRRFAAALLPRLFGTNPRSHHKGATDRV